MPLRSIHGLHISIRSFRIDTYLFIIGCWCRFTHTITNRNTRASEQSAPHSSTVPRSYVPRLNVWVLRARISMQQTLWIEFLLSYTMWFCVFSRSYSLSSRLVVLFIFCCLFFVSLFYSLLLNINSHVTNLCRNTYHFQLFSDKSFGRTYVRAKVRLFRRRNDRPVK